MSNIQYSVEFHAVKYTKYKSGAPKHLLKKVGRWQKAGIYGGFDNIDYAPEILTSNKSLYEAAPDIHKALTKLTEMYTSMINSGDCGNWNPEEDEEVILAREALSKARGE